MSGSTFRQQVAIFNSRSLSPQAQSATLAEAARRGVTELIASGRANPDYTRFVDGVRGAPEGAVKPDGVILYQFEYLGEVAAFALGYLIAQSPQRSGAFRRNWFVAVNGRPIRAASFDPERSVPPGAKIIIFNRQPYARKVDVQRVGKRPLRFSVPADALKSAVTEVRRRFGNAVEVERIDRAAIPYPYQLKGGRYPGRAVDTPAIIITRR